MTDSKANNKKISEIAAHFVQVDQVARPKTTYPEAIPADTFTLPECRIGILGAGLSGLQAAKVLSQIGGQKVTVLEGRNRLGGRAFSGTLAGHIVEIGAELLDECHTQMRALCAELNVPLHDHYAPGQTHSHLSFVVDGEHISREKLAVALTPFIEKLNRDRELMDSPSPAGDALKKRLLETSAAQYFREVSLPEWAVKTMEAHFGGEFGAASESSSLLFIEHMGYHTVIPEQPHFGVAGYGRFTVTNGVSTLVDALADTLQAPKTPSHRPVTIELGHKVTAIRQVCSEWEVESKVGNEKVLHHFDYLVVTIPFPVLRKIDLSGAHLSAERLEAIKSTQLSSNGKILRVVKNSYNPEPQTSTTFSADFLGTGATDCWLRSRNDGLRSDTEQVRVHYLPATDQALLAAGSEATLLKASEQEWDKQFIGGDHSGPAKFCAWHNDPFALGSYATFAPGEMDRLDEGLRTRVQNDPVGFYTAGESHDKEFNGYMEGAIRQGRKAGQEIIESIVRNGISAAVLYS